MIGTLRTARLRVEVQMRCSKVRVLGLSFLAGHCLDNVPARGARAGGPQSRRMLGRLGHAQALLDRCHEQHH